MAKRSGPATVEPKGSERGQGTKHTEVEHIAKKNGAVQVLPTSKLHFQKLKPAQPTRVREKIIDFDFEEEDTTDVTAKATPVTCALCGLESQETLGEFLSLKRPNDSKLYHVHENCLWYSQRNQDESDSMLLNRIYATNRKCCFDQCKRKKRASVTCIVKSCPNVFHFMCAKRAGAELCPNQYHSKLYCKDHMSRAAKAKKSQCQWPTTCAIEYITRNNWAMMPITIFNFILDNRDAWEKYTPEWFKTDLEPRISVRQIFPGHWAWCEELGKSQNKPQYEVVANNDIDADEFICEYVGAVKYHRDCVESRYVAAFYIPESINFADDLCLDAETCGNEARFINSVSPTTPSYIQQNATMSTVWCRGELRIIVSATRDIPKYHPIVLNYDEFENSYFEKNLTPTERRVKRLQGNPSVPFVYLSLGDQGPDPLLEEEIRENKQIRMEQRRQAKQDVESMFDVHTNSDPGSEPQPKNKNTTPKPKASKPRASNSPKTQADKIKPKQNNMESGKVLAKKIQKVTEKSNAVRGKGTQGQKVTEKQLVQHVVQKKIARLQSIKPVQNTPEKQPEPKQKQQQSKKQVSLQPTSKKTNDSTALKQPAPKQQSEPKQSPLFPPQREIIEIDDDDSPKPSLVVAKLAEVVAKPANSPAKRTFAEISDSDIGSNEEESEYEEFSQSSKRQKTSSSGTSRPLTRHNPQLHSFMPSLAPIIIDDDDFGVVHVDDMSEDDISKDLLL